MTKINQSFEMKKYLMTQHKYICFDDTLDLYVYDEKQGIYTNHSTIEHAKSEVSKKLGDDVNEHVLKETISLLSIDEHVLVNRAIANADKKLICVDNGILNVETLEFNPHTKDIVFVTKIPVIYDSKADCPLFKQCLSQWMNPEDALTFQMYLGFMLVNHYDYHKAVIIVGERRTGKTTTLNIIQKMFGEDNIANVSIQEMCDDQFASIELYGKTLNLCDDMDDMKAKNVTKFKKATGDSKIRGRDLYKKAFYYYNTAKILYACNKLPTSENADLAYYGRWIIIPFKNKFIAGDNAVIGLDDKICTPEELSGILNFAIEGYRLLTSLGGFPDSDEYAQSTKYRWLSLASDSVSAFIGDACVIESESKVIKKILYKAYKEYCFKDNSPSLEYNSFCLALKDRIGNQVTGIGEHDKIYETQADGSREYVIHGIRLKRINEEGN